VVIPEKLRQCWHPVAYGHEVAGAPQATRLLDEALVLWRSSDGRAHAMRDLCIHRGTALSLGWIADDCLVCPYHAWRYDASGACVRIPQSAHATIPVKARTPAYRCQERYGLIWVCLAEAEPAYAVPEVPELESESWKVVKTGPFEWATDASRQVENFTDFGHFPWVHPGLLGDPERPVVPDHQVETRGHVLHYQVVRPEAANSDDFQVFANEQTDRPVRRSRYELHLPYTIALRLGWGGEKGMVYFFASQPVASNRCRGFCVIARNYDFDDPDETLQKFEAVIFGQDQRVVESQRPEQVPFDLAEELHLQFDAVAIAYRKAMQTEQLAWHGPFSRSGS
jgi:vanillate O-demethylase monooxygenase subunit